MNYNVSDGRKYIWLFWYQGFDEAPQLVTRCVESIRKHANDYEVILLDKNNYAKWVELDKSIHDALEKNEIGLAHFSDFLRLKLLIEYGGVWIDPTVYMTDRIPDDISSADIFMFKGPNRSELLLQDRGCVSNWFILAKPNNVVLSITYVLMTEYIKKNHKFCDYYMTHWILTYVFRKCTDEWEKIPFYPSVMPHYFQFCDVTNRYDKKKWDTIQRISFVHKLSYKIEVKEGSYLERLILGID